MVIVPDRVCMPDGEADTMLDSDFSVKVCRCVTVMVVSKVLDGVGAESERVTYSVYDCVAFGVYEIEILDDSVLVMVNVARFPFADFVSVAVRVSENKSVTVEVGDQLGVFV